MIDISQAVDKLRRKDWLGSGMSGGERRRVTIICRHEAMGDRSMVISAAPDDLVESLLATFCLEVNIQLESDAVLRSADRHLIDPAVTVAEAGLQNGDIITLEHLSKRIFSVCLASSVTLFLPSITGENHVQLRHTFWPLCILAFLIGAAGLCAILILFFLPAVPIADVSGYNGAYPSSNDLYSCVFSVRSCGQWWLFSVPSFQLQMES